MNFSIELVIWGIYILVIIIYISRGGDVNIQLEIVLA